MTRGGIYIVNHAVVTPVCPASSIAVPSPWTGTRYSVFTKGEHLTLEHSSSTNVMTQLILKSDFLCSLPIFHIPFSRMLDMLSRGFKKFTRF